MSRLLKTELVIPAAAPADVTFWDQETFVEDLSAWLSSNSLQGWEELTSPATGDVTLRFYLEPESPLAGVLKDLVGVRWPGVALSMESMEQQDWSAAWHYDIYSWADVSRPVARLKGNGIATLSCD